MKICKVEIIKKLSGNKCVNVYPVGYNTKNVNIIAYDEESLIEGDNIGYCIGFVSDYFSFTDKMIEINKTNADIFIDARSEKETNEDLRIAFAASRKDMITDAGIV